jgi:hypothetical protein
MTPLHDSWEALAKFKSVLQSNYLDSASSNLQLIIANNKEIFAVFNEMYIKSILI